jgi:hypothetical protein
MADVLDNIPQGAVHIRKTNGRFVPVVTGLAAAKAAAVSGDTVIVGPGAYTVTTSLEKDGVSWEFAEGAIVSSESILNPIWNVTTGITVRVAGRGDFRNTYNGVTTAADVLKVSHASANVSFQCRRITSTKGVCVNAENGTLIGHADVIDPTGSWAIWWQNGDCKFTVPKIGGALGLYVSDGGTPTGEFYLTTHDLRGVLSQFVGHVNSRTWITALVTRGTMQFAGGKVYLIAEKCEVSNDAPVLWHTGGDLWANVQKVSTPATTAYPLQLSGLSSRVEVQQIEVTSAGVPALVYSGNGTHHLRFLDGTNPSGDGITVDGGTVTLHGGKLTTTGTDLIQTNGTLNVIGGAGSGASGAYTESGTVTRLVG